MDVETVFSKKAQSNNMDIFLTIYWSTPGLGCASMKWKPFEINARVFQAVPEPSSSCPSAISFPD